MLSRLISRIKGFASIIDVSKIVVCVFNTEYEIRGILREFFVLDFESAFVRRTRIFTC